MRFRLINTLIFCFVLAVHLASSLVFAANSLADDGTPKLFNLYLRNFYPAGYTQSLARFDVLGLDVDTPRSVVDEIRSYNPNIKILGYIPINGTYANAPALAQSSKWRRLWELANAQPQTRWLLSTTGQHMYDWPGKYTINLTFNCAAEHTLNQNGDVVAPNCPSSETNKLNWYVDFVIHDVLEDGASAWDGVILDDVWVGIWFINQDTALNPNPMDIDQDGLAEAPTVVNPLWKQGNRYIMGEVRRRLDAAGLGRLTSIGNGGNDFEDVMNGAYIENFQKLDVTNNFVVGNWNSGMFEKLAAPKGYFAHEGTYLTDNPPIRPYNGRPNRVNVLDFKILGISEPPPVNLPTSPDIERFIRFGLGSALLKDGYYSVDTAYHNIATWWHPLFDKTIGPVDTAVNGGSAQLRTMAGMQLWTRAYQNGIVVVNQNSTLFPGSQADGIPPIPANDSAILLNSELWVQQSTPPPAISTLQVTRSTSSSIEVGWTNVACDADNKASGQCSAIEIRYSASPITAGNYAAASAVSLFAPKAPGMSEQYQLTGISPNQTLYFAMKTKDLSGNWSAISNVVSGATVVSDAVPPAAISDLTVVSTTTTGATVRWTAPGDDGLTGNASAFDLRYATFPLNDSNWNLGAQVQGEPAPGAPGTLQSMVLYGMTPSTTYYFGIKTLDEMPNASALSNLPSAQTQLGDVTAPGSISDLAVVSVAPGSVTLRWTAPGDDGATGTAAMYQLRYTPAQTFNWSTANDINNEPAPLPAGRVQTFTVTGLGLNGYSYNFALKTCDEFPNCSTQSNVVQATTGVVTDTAAPGAVSDLAVLSTTASSITLSWTAPGDDGLVGYASGYDLRYSTAPINASNFAAATQVSPAVSPRIAGSAQTATVSGLTQHQNYFFALRASDEASNLSVLSNVVAGSAEAPAAARPGAPSALGVRISP